ncbi:acetylglucosaminyldiphospho-UDP acetyl-beta-D-mannosaminyltransferase [Bacillus thuringiensis]|uniref:N-acetylglucosaminyldiphosphoundecaprenol N-acetyl-beta-D-mannosaminyltransferase n=1 Tax=Bacillus thuringiensis TaxID=1428 RepID=A0A9W3SC03_BACTU|nr:WecB/TagA/CpsF family glycosyltransferase [Bacillus thuringiensis]ANS48474.1 putative N-acetylmannosaminyltransferase TarA [Bacillus thuringiensis]MBH0334717.1 acetylglucosaminyldiphospho-UDP acetyl-beta-D-mannosaminyltransferase [Bacillus thuringiensis]
MDQQFIKGIPFSTLEYAKAISLLKGWIHEQQEKPRFVVTANPEIVMSAKENTEKSKQFKKMLLSADLITADGIGVIIGSKILKGTLRERVTGADLTHDLIKYCNDNEYRVFLFGAAPESNKKALEKLNEQFPGAQFKGQHGFVNGEEIEKIKIKIKQFKPHLLLVGLGSPKQEEFIYENIQTLNVPLSIGIGGMIDIISGTVKRAPKMMRDTGTEWLYRLLSQPKRLKRQLVLPKFLLSVMLERVKGMPS